MAQNLDIVRAANKEAELAPHIVALRAEICSMRASADALPAMSPEWNDVVRATKQVSAKLQLAISVETKRILDAAGWQNNSPKVEWTYD